MRGRSQIFGTEYDANFAIRRLLSGDGSLNVIRHLVVKAYSQVGSWIKGLRAECKTPHIYRKFRQRAAVARARRFLAVFAHPQAGAVKFPAETAEATFSH
jgi:hypothetical protein